MINVENLSDDKLMNIIIERQTQYIRLQKRFAHNPLAIPPRTLSRRIEDDALWRKAIERNLHKRINEKVKAIIDEA